jgi:TetR/AcrR family tetracycline transcriptional repressor
MALDRQLILHQAFVVLNEAGLEGLTLRRLAARLHVQAPAIYWHFKDKRDLLDEMATQVLRESMDERAALESLPTWQEWATACHERLRKTLLRYRDGAKMFSGTYLTDSELFAPMEANLRRLTQEGFTLRQAVIGLVVLYSYTIGFVIEEQATQFAPGVPNPQYDLAARERRVNKELYPLAAAAGAEMFAHHEARFAEGLAVVVNGLAAKLVRAGATH